MDVALSDMIKTMKKENIGYVYVEDLERDLSTGIIQGKLIATNGTFG